MSHRVEVIRSDRRKKTISARVVEGTIVVRVPAGLSAAAEAKAVADVVASVEKKLSSSARTDADLERRARLLNKTVLEGRASIGSIRWVTNQKHRWGSCSPLTNDIRISHVLQQVPDYVLDSVIVHELVHTFIHSGHSTEFWNWADKAPKAERAKGFLEAFGQLSGRDFD